MCITYYCRGFGVLSNNVISAKCRICNPFHRDVTFLIGFILVLLNFSSSRQGSQCTICYA